MLSASDIKKSSKRPEETKPNKVFTDLFGAPLKKPDARSLQNSSPNPTKLQTSSSIKTTDKTSSSLVTGGKDKSEKTKHKHSPNKGGKDKKSSDGVKIEQEKQSKKDKPKDRERSDKKEKVSKRQSSPSSSSSSARNSTNLNALPQSKNDVVKPHPKQSSTPVPTSDLSFSKKSNKKDKKSHEKERDRNEKKDARSKELSSTKEKSHFDLPPSKGSSASMKERELTAKDERDKMKIKSAPEPKTSPMEIAKKQHDKDSERKHKHKKKEKAKEKDAGKDSKKEKAPRSIAAPAQPPPKAKETSVVKQEFKTHLSDKDSSDTDVDSPPSIKQDSDNSMPELAPHKPGPEKSIKKPRERTKPADKEDKSRKRKSSRKDDRDSSASPPPTKLSRKDLSKSPSIHERPSSSDSHAHHSHTHNNNNIDGNSKISNEYMNELKELKLKITTLKNNDELQHVVRLIAATGCYEITKSSFDFDLVQLDRGTVKSLQDFFATS